MQENTRRYDALPPGKENLRWTERNVRWLRRFLLLLLRPKVELTVEGGLPAEGPVLVLANHAHFLDPFLLILAAGRPIHFLATESLWHQRMTALCCWLVGAIPRKKFVNDNLSVRQLCAWKMQGGAVGLFPEGERSWDGRPLPLVPGIERLVRLVNAPVVCCRIYNGHRHGPRWGAGMRSGRLHIVFDPPRAFARDTPVEEILAFIEQNIRPDTSVGADWPLRSGLFGGGLAEGLGNLLFLCPACGAQDRLQERGDRIACSACSAVWRVDTQNRLHPEPGAPAAGPLALTDAVDAMKARLHARQDAEAAGPPDAKLLESAPMTLLRIDGPQAERVGAGRLCLSRERLWLEAQEGASTGAGASANTGASAGAAWEVPLSGLAAVAVDLRRRLQFRTRDDQTFEAVMPAESVVKWHWIAEHWRRLQAPPV